MTTSTDISIVQLECPSGSKLIYDVNFFRNHIQTLITRAPAIVNSWITNIERVHGPKLNHLVVGLDIEWCADFSGNKIEHPVAIIQLCIGRNCLIFQILRAPSFPPSLATFLSNPNYTFTGVAIANDAEKLLKDYKLKVLRMADLRDLAVRVYEDKTLKNVGLKVLTKKVLGRDIEKRKKDTLSKWNNFYLTYNQIKYACVDAYVSFEIGRILISKERNLRSRVEQ